LDNDFHFVIVANVFHAIEDQQLQVLGLPSVCSIQIVDKCFW